VRALDERQPLPRPTQAMEPGTGQRLVQLSYTCDFGSRSADEVQRVSGLSALRLRSRSPRPTSALMRKKRPSDETRNGHGRAAAGCRCWMPTSARVPVMWSCWGCTAVQRTAPTTTCDRAGCRSAGERSY
jgi:hypothetical protein